MINKINQFLSFIKRFPFWLRAILLLLICGILLIFSTTSCGQVVKVVVRDTPSGVEITTSQIKRDSSSTNINLNPSFNYGY